MTHFNLSKVPVCNSYPETQIMMTQSQGQATFACPGAISRLICRLSISEIFFAHTVASREFLWLLLCAFSRSVLGSGAFRALEESLCAVGTETLHIWGQWLNRSNASSWQLGAFRTAGGCPGGGKGNPLVCLWTVPSLTLTGPSEQRQRFTQAWHSAPRFLHITLRMLGLSVR